MDIEPFEPAQADVIAKELAAHAGLWRSPNPEPSWPTGRPICALGVPGGQVFRRLLRLGAWRVYCRL